MHGSSARFGQSIEELDEMGVCVSVKNIESRRRCGRGLFVGPFGPLRAACTFTSTVHRKRPPNPLNCVAQALIERTRTVVSIDLGFVDRLNQKGWLL